MERVAVISDVHGNRWALEAVLADIHRQGISAVINLGDSVYGPLDPAGTAEILLREDWPTVRGNEDRIITDGGSPVCDTLVFVRAHLRSVHLGWLRSLRPSIVLDGAFLCHGTPDRDTAYLLWDVVGAGARPRGAEDVASELAGIAPSLILCGHDHVQATVRLPDGRMVVDPGSVGLQAYRDDVPRPHVMQTGTPHARYSAICRDGRGWSVTERTVPYDWQAAAHAAERNGRPDWAAWLRTGRAGDDGPEGQAPLP